MTAYILTSGQTSTGKPLSSGDSLVVSSGGVATSTMISAGASVTISSAGVTTGSVASGGTEYVSSGGVASGTVLTSGATDYLLSSGTASGTLISSGSQYVSSGGLATGTVLAGSGAYQQTVGGNTSGTVVSGGSILYDYSGTTTHATVSSGGLLSAYSYYGSAILSGTVVSSGGVELDINGATAVATTVLAGGRESVSSGSVTSGSIVSSGGVEYVSSGATASGTVLMTGGTLVVLAGGSAVATVSSGGTVASGVVLLNNSGLLVSGGPALSNVVVSSAYTETVAAGGIATSSVVSSGGSIAVSSGGTTTGTVVSAGASETVASGGSANSTVLSGGQEQVLSGATVSGTIVSSGNQYVSSGGVAQGTVLAGSGATEQMTGGSTSGTVVSSGAVLFDFGGTTTGAVISSGGLLSAYTYYSSAVLSNTVISSGGAEIDGNGTVATGTTVLSGGRQNDLSGGTTSGSVISSGGIEYVSSGATASGTVLMSGGQLVVLAGGSAIGVVNSGGSVVSGVVVLDNSGTLVTGGLSVTGAIVSSGFTETVGTGGVATSSVISTGGNAFVSSGGTDSGTVLSGGIEYVSSGGVATGTVILAGGQESISSGGQATGTVVNSGTLYVYSSGMAAGTVLAGSRASGFSYGGTINGATLTGGAQLTDQGGTITGTVVSSGSIVSAGYSYYGSALLSGTVVSSGGAEVDGYGGASTGTMVLSGGRQTVMSTATVNGTVVSSGGIEYVSSGGVVSGTVLMTGALLVVLPGGSAVNIVSSGGTVVSGVVVLNGAGSFVAGGSALTGAVVSSGYTETVGGGIATSSVILGGGQVTVSSGGVTSGTIVSGGTEYVLSGGLASATVLLSGTTYVSSGGTTSGLVVSSGAQYVYGSANATMLAGSGAVQYNEGGSISGTTIASGGVLDDLYGTASGTIVGSGGVLSAGYYYYYSAVLTGTVVSSGGVEIDAYGAIASGTTVLSGGVETVSSGASALGATISSGGFLFVSLGGTASGATLAAGATLVVLAGGTVTAPVNNGGTIISGGGVVVTNAAGTIVSSALIVSGAVLGSGFTAAVNDGGYASATVVSSGGAISVGAAGSANFTIVGSSGTMTVSAYGQTYATSVGSAGLETVLSGGAVSVTTVSSGGTETVSAGGIARGVSIAAGAVQQVYGVASGTTVNGSIASVTVSGAEYVYAGGLASGTTLNNGAALYLSGGVAAGVVVRSGSVISGYAGAALSGSVVSGGGVQNDAAGEAVGGTVLSGGQENLAAGARNTGTVIGSGGTESVQSGAVTNATVIFSGGTEIVSAGASASGTVVLAGGSLVVLAGGQAVGTTSGGVVVVNSSGQLVAAGPALSGSVVNYGFTETIAGPGIATSSLVSGGIVTILSGGLGSGATISGGYEYVSSGGTASNTLLAGGYEYVFSSGATTGTVVTGNGQTLIYSGGTASGTVVSTGTQQISSGGTAQGTVLAGSGAYQYDYGGATSGTIVSGGGQVYAYGGTATGTIIGSGGTVYTYNYYGAAVLSGTVIGSGGNEFISGGAIASGTTVLAGGRETLQQGGIASGTVVSSGGVEYISSGGTASGTVLMAGGSLVVLAGGSAVGVVSSGGTVYSGVLLLNGSGGLVSGGTSLSGLLVSSGYSETVGAGGTATSSIISAYGSSTVLSGGVVSGTTVRQYGNEYVSSGGTASGTVVSSGGTQQVFAGGVTLGTAVLGSGGMEYVAGGTASGTTVSAGGTLNLQSGTVSGATIGSGGVLSGYYYASGTITGAVIGSGGAAVLSSYYTSALIATGDTVQAGGQETIGAGAVTIGTVVSSGGVELVSSGGIASGTVLQGGGTLVVLAGGTAAGVVSSGGTVVSGVVVLNGQGVFLGGGSAASGLVVSAGSTETVTSGGVATGTFVSSGGTDLVLAGGVVSATTVGSGASESLSSGGTASGTLISGGVEFVYSGGLARGATLVETAYGYAGVQYVEGGTASGTTLSSGTTLYFYSGSLVGTTVSSGGVLSSIYYASGTISNTVIGNGGLEVLSGGYYSSGTLLGTGATILGGGRENVFSGAATSGTTISSGGIQTVNAGATATGTVISSGGFEYVSSGGSVSGTVLLTGGTLVLLSGATATGTVNSGGVLTSGGVLLLNASGTQVSAGLALSGLAVSAGYSEVVGLAGIATSSVVAAGGSVTVIAGGVTSGTVLSGGSESISTSGVASATVVRGGSELVGSGGVASGTVISGGSQTVSSGGVASGTVLASAGTAETVFAGGTASGTTATSGTSIVEYGGLVAGAVLSSGATLNLVAGYAGSASGTTVGSGAMVSVGSGGSEAGATIGSGGVEIVLAGGTTTGSILLNGALETVSSGGVASGTVLNAGATLVVLPTGSAVGTVLNGGTLLSGGVFVLNNTGGVVVHSATLNGATVTAGNQEVVGAGGIAVATVLSNAVATYFSGGVASNTVLQGGYEVVQSGGVASGTVVGAGTEYVSSGGLTTGTVLSGGLEIVYAGGTASGTTVGQGEQLLVSGGLASGAVVNGGATLVLAAGGSASATVVSSGGAITVGAGATDTGATLGSGGAESVASGGVASATAVNSGGVETVSSGGVASGTVVAAGGTLNVLAGGTAGGGTAVAMSNAGTLHLSGGTLAGSGGVNAATGLIVGSGAISLAGAGLDNEGVLEASGGTLSAGTVTGAGSVQIDAGAVFEVGTALGQTVNLQSGGVATLALDAPGAFTGTIAGAQVGDIIDFVRTNVTSASLNGKVLSVMVGATSYSYTFATLPAQATVTLASDKAGGTDVVLAQVSAPVVQVGTGPIAFANVRVGTTDSQAISITNAAASPAESLDVAAVANGSATVSGSVSRLAAGQTSTSILAGLPTTAAGVETGTITLTFAADDGNGTVTPLPAQTVTLNVTGTAYNEAAYSLSTPSAPVLHVHDAGTLTLTARNTAAGSYSENLVASVTAASGSATAGAGSGEIAAQGSGTVGYTIDTSAAGVVAGSVTVQLQSDGTGIDNAGPTTIGTQMVAVGATIDNYAVAGLTASTGTVTSGTGGTTISLGSVLQDSTSGNTITFALANTATGTADVLGGQLVAISGGGFSTSALTSASGVMAGGSQTLGSISLSTATEGTFSETFQLASTGSNSGGYSGALANQTVTLTGTVLHHAVPQLTVGGIVVPSQALAGQIVPITWTVTNQGDGTATGPWNDEIFLASDAAGDNPVLVGTFVYTDTLAPGASVTRTGNVLIPSGAAGQNYFVVRADANDALVEHVPDSTKQTVASTATTLAPVPTAALVVSSITPPTSADSGDTTQVSWVVTNNGNGATSAGYWTDNVYLSLDRTLDTSDILLASVTNPTYLAAGASYSSSATVTLPKGISGPYYIIVYADVSSTNGTHGGSTVIASQVSASAPFPVTLSPQPDLVVTKILTPSQEFSGQPATLSWTVANNGSAGTGATSWSDEVLLSTNGLLDSNSTVLADVYHSGALAVGQSYNNSATVTLPIGESGNYTLFVVADGGSQVYEVPGANNHDLGVPVQVNLTPPPDLVTTVGALPTATITGHTLSVSYTVTNSGSTDTPNSYWTDTVYLSTTQTLGSGAINLGNIAHGGSLAVGQSYTATPSFTLANTLSGQYYVIVQADSGNSVFELNKTNNVADGTPITIAYSAVDLVVSSVTAPATGTAGHSVLVSWQVTNSGAGDTSNSTWTDQVILSASGVLGAADNVVLATVLNPASLQGGGSYSSSASVVLPTTLNGSYKLFVLTNTTGSLVESNTANDASSPQSLAVTPLPQLQVSAVSGPSSDTAGDSVNIGWTVTNSSVVATPTGAWTDNVYLSNRMDLSGNYVLLGSVAHTGALAAGAAYNASSSFTLPSGLGTGPYYFVVKTDAQAQVLQVGSAGDVAGSAIDSITQLPTSGGGSSGGTTSPGTLGVPVVVLPPSDIAISNVTGPSEIQSGQAITVGWTLSDTGNATTGTFYDEVYLSRDQVLNTATAVSLGSFQHNTALAAGSSQSFSTTLSVPSGLSGPYYVLVAADAGSALNDPNQANNLAVSSVFEVDLPPPIDLVAGAVGFGTAAAGSITVTYSVSNTVASAATGSWEDAVYLSTTGVFNVSDPLLGYVQHTGGIAANGSYTGTLTAALPGLVSGSYYAIVKVNVRNNEPESTQANNTGLSTTTVSVAEPVLTLGTPATGTLTAGEMAYYQFTVGAGQTVKLALTSDTAGTANDIYASYGTIPTIGQFDVTSTVALSQNPGAIIQESQPGTYYVMVRESAGSPENYTLTASTVQFSITSVGSNIGSNVGSATITLNGADLAPNDVVEIIGADGTVRTASTVDWVNSGQLWATFNLQGLSVGSYTVDVLNGTQTATLANGYTVTNGAAGHLGVSLVAPPQLHTHNAPNGLTGTENGIVTIQYSNTGGTDIAAPIFDLQATNAQFNAGVVGLVSPTEISIVGTNQTGPAGILQPGSTETVAYTFAGNFGYAQFINMQLALGVLTGSNASIDLSSLESTVKPAFIDSADWHLIWTRFEAQLGGTTQGLVNALSQAATTLSQIGDSTNDFGTLLGYEIEQATGTLPNTTLATTVDLAGSGPGIDLSLTRTYSASLLNREAAGAFGDGWTFTYAIKAITDTTGNVYINSPAGTETFTIQANGSYLASAGDSATLKLVNGGYVLTSISGTVETFRADGQIATITDAVGNVVTLSYGSTGAISGITSSNGQSLTFTTGTAGQITSAADASGKTVTYSYDSTGTQLLSVAGAAGTTHYTYDGNANPQAANALAGIANPDGTTQSFTYDSLGGLASKTATGATGQLSFAYNGPGVVIETDARGAVSTLFYDTKGNLAEVQDAAGNVTRLTYDSTGKLTGVTGPDGSKYAFTYDASGNLTSYTNPLGGKVTATYQAGTTLLTSYTDQDGNKTQYSYTSTGSLTGTTYAASSGSTYSYAANGALTSTTDARGQTTTYSYDTTGHLTNIAFSDGTSQAYTYDKQGDLLTAKATGGGVTKYTYNAAGALSSVDDPSGRLETYGYNAAGQEIQRVEPDGSITNYTYTATGQIAGLTDGTGAMLAKYSYNVVGQLTNAAMGNGSTTRYSYDVLGNVTQIQTKAANGSLTSELDYSYDADARPLTVKSLDGTWSYTYDASGQLTHAVFASTNASIANQDLAYVYDAAGNRTQTIFNGATSNYTTNGLNQYTAADGTTYGYDADGNLTSKTAGGQTTTYTYNSQNQLLSTTAAGTTTSYTYDALGNQVTSTVGGVTSSYVIDPLAISTSAAGPLSSIAQVYSASGVTATYNYANGLLSLTSGSQTYYYNSDNTGDVVSLTGASGTIADSYVYDPFGNLVASTGSLSNPYQFSGLLGATTAAGGTIDLRARSYDPVTGRFTSRDPLGIAAGTNAYTYVLNAPTDATDPTGLLTLNLGVGGSYFEGVGGGLSGGIFVTTNNQYGYPDIGVYGTVAAGAGLEASIGGQGGFFTGDLGNFQGVSYQGSVDLEAVGVSVAGNKGGVGAGLSIGPGAGAAVAVTNTGTIALGEDIIAPIVHFFDPVVGSGSPVSVAGVNSVDPNDIIGPISYGAQNFVAKGATYAYTINFENAKTASAPAQAITITQQLDPNLDWRTFRLTGFGFDNLTTTLSGSQAFYSGLLDYSATKGYDVQVTAGVNVVTGVVTWLFQTIDPATGQAPSNPQLGLLPVDDATGDGEGFVTYTVQAKSTVTTGATIAAQAVVIFDTNAPINTPAIVDTIDGIAPTSAVVALPGTEATPSFEVDWSGTDDAAGSGLASYTIDVSDNGAAPTVWLANTTRTNAIFTGTAGHNYAFTSMAMDNAGNTEALRALADTATTVACYLHGTLIATPGGEVPIETLAIGDLITTADGPARPIRWIGRRSYDSRFVAGNPDVIPIRIARGAMADGVPHTDLLVSPLHAMFVGGVLIPAKLLVNGETITEAVDIELIRYVHLELSSHDILLANGAPSESFVDCDSRGMFHNEAEYAALYPNDPGQRWTFCAPRIEDGHRLQDVRAHLAARAGLVPVSPLRTGALSGYLDTLTPDVIRGWAWQPDHPDEPVRLEVLVDGGVVAQVIANHERSDVRKAGFGNGRCGFHLTLEKPLSPFRAHVVEVRRVGDGQELGHSPQELKAAPLLDAAAREALTAAIQGHAAGASEAEMEALLGVLVDGADRLLQACARQPSAPAPAKRRRRAKVGVAKAGVAKAGAVKAGAGPLALVLDDRMPTPDKDAGSGAVLDHMRSLVRLGYRVGFVPRDMAIKGKSARTLDKAGIMRLGAPYYAGVEDVLRQHAGQVTLVYVHRVSNMALYGEMVRHFCPKARLVYSVADLHFLRHARQEAIQDEPAANSRHLQEKELAAARMADAVITHSTYETALLGQMLPGLNVHTVPWSFEAGGSAIPFGHRAGVAFIGSYEHRPNVDAAVYLIREVMPLVWQQDPSIECLLVGSNMPESLRRLTGGRVVAMGHVPDLDTVFDEVRLTVAPLRFGAGLKGKVLQSMAAGVPCVCTTVAAEGMAWSNEQDTLVGHDSSELAALIVRLHRDPVEHGRQVAAGLDFVVRTLQPDTIDRLMATAVSPVIHHLAAVRA